MNKIIIEMGNYSVKVFKENKLIFNESNLVVYDLLNKKRLGLGETSNEVMKSSKNILATRFIEKNKIINFASLTKYMEFLDQKFDLRNNSFYLVSNFEILSKSKTKLINAYKNLIWLDKFEFYKITYANFERRYVDFGYYETKIVDFDKQTISIIEYGFGDLQKDIHKFIYLNYGCLLNTKKQ